ncbi:MAG: response regulator [Pirellulales bacterium]
MPALVLTADLTSIARVEAAGKSRGCRVESALSVAALLEKLAEGPADLVIVDLGMSGLDVRQLLAQLQDLPRPPSTVIAFGPHVHHDKLAAAAQAGADRVLSRGQFFAQADDLLRQYADVGA